MSHRLQTQGNCSLASALLVCIVNNEAHKQLSIIQMQRHRRNQPCQMHALNVVSTKLHSKCSSLKVRQAGCHQAFVPVRLSVLSAAFLTPSVDGSLAEEGFSSAYRMPLLPRPPPPPPPPPPPRRGHGRCPSFATLLRDLGTQDPHCPAESTWYRTLCYLYRTEESSVCGK